MIKKHRNIIIQPLLKALLLVLLTLLPVFKTNAQAIDVQALTEQIDPGQLQVLVDYLTQTYNDTTNTSENNSIRINAFVSFDEDSALIPYMVELYTKTRMVQREPFVNLEIELVPKGDKWNDFTDYGMQLHAYLSPQIAQHQQTVDLVINEINTKLLTKLLTK